MPDDDLIVDEENQGFEEPKDLDETPPVDDHEIPEVASVDDTYHHDTFHVPVASPAVTGEENVFSGDATEGEPADIDEELKKVGLENDDDGVKSLSSDDID